MSLAALGALVGGGAAAGATLVGGVLSGVASAWSAKSAAKAEEKSRIDEENRRKANYEGLGKSTRYWENSQPADQQATQQKAATMPALGRRPDQVGSKYAMPASPKQPQQEKPRWKFDPQSGQIARS